jgi:hypothetical protein
VEVKAGLDKQDKKKGKKIDGSSAKEAHENLPPTWEGRQSKIPFKEICKHVKNWADALHPYGIDMVQRAERGLAVDVAYIQTLAGMEEESDAKSFKNDFEGRLFRMLTKHMQGDASAHVPNKDRNGLESWRSLCGHFDPQDQAGKSAAYTRITNPGKRAKDTQEARRLVREWQVKVDDYESRYEAVENQQKISTLMGILPINAVDNVFRAKVWATFDEMRKEVIPWLEYRTTEEANKESKASPEGPTPMDLDSFMESATEEQKSAILAQVKGGKGNGKGEGFKGNWYQPYRPKDDKRVAGGKGDKGGKGGKGGKSWKRWKREGRIQR